MSAKQRSRAAVTKTAPTPQPATVPGAMDEKGREWAERVREAVRRDRESAPAEPEPKQVREAYRKGLEERRSFEPTSKRGELYADGECITRFLRLPDSEDAATAFHADYPRYFPPEFWTWQLPSDAEQFAGAVFLPGYDPRVSGVMRPAYPFWRAYRNVLRAAWASGFDDEYVVRLLNLPTSGNSEDTLKQRVPPLLLAHTIEYKPHFNYQHDILTLVRSTWRAKECAYCREPFVADKPSRWFCPERFAAGGDPEMSCYKQHRREVKRDLWGRKGKQYRRSSKSKKGSTNRRRAGSTKR
jgi:hypothetical protein